MPEYLEFAQMLAAQAGTIMQSEREGRLRIQQKPDRTLVTHVDLAINDLAIDAIRQNFRGHRVKGEERSFGPVDAEHVWWVDPLDGTGNYIDGEDLEDLTYGFGIAKQYRGNLEVGLFLSPPKDELYTAAHGLGAYMNGSPIRVSNRAFQIGTPYDYSHWEGAEPDGRRLEQQLGAPLGHYSAIYQGCMVAAGKSAFSVFPGSTGHDIAPAAILVAEAGGKTTDVLGQEHNFNTGLQGAVFSNGVVHRQVLDILAA